MGLIIRAENLGKQYRIGAKAEGYSTFRESIIKTLTRPFNLLKGGNGTKGVKLWALRDVNFEIMSGEVVGVIGRNGAGKSTLLKVLSRITEPTTGKCELYGRVGSLLEVGTGFHWELTGRENIFLSGAILGMKRGEIKNKFDEIVNFAEIDKFIDTPVKRYSSGMYMRLAFAVAANLEPEILVVDEVLAVGDADFQKKCLGKMSEVAEGGRTVLFVSHNMSAISTLTKRCIFLANGRVDYIGDTATAIQKYMAHRKTENQIYLAEPKSDRPSLTRVEVFTSEPDNVHAHGAPLRVEFDVNMPYASEGVGVSFQVMDNLSKPIMASWAFPSVKPLFSQKGKHTVCCTIPKSRLYMNEYSLTVGLADERGPEIFEILPGICNFEVQMYGISAGHPYGWIRDVCTYIEESEWSII